MTVPGHNPLFVEKLLFWLDRPQMRIVQLGAPLPSLAADLQDRGHLVSSGTDGTQAVHVVIVRNLVGPDQIAEAIAAIRPALSPDGILFVEGPLRGTNPSVVAAALGRHRLLPAPPIASWFRPDSAGLPWRGVPAALQVYVATHGQLPSVPIALALPPERMLALVTHLAESAMASHDEGLFWYALANTDRLPEGMAFEAHQLKCRMFVELDRPEWGIGIARRMIELKPHDPKGREQLFQALRIAPTMEALVDLAEATFTRGDVQGAIELFLDAVRIEPGTAAAWVGLGVSLHASGLRDRALAVLDQALTLDGHHREALLNRFHILAEPGLSSEAREAGVRFVAAFPDAPEAVQISALLGLEGP